MLWECGEHGGACPTLGAGSQGRLLGRNGIATVESWRGNCRHLGQGAPPTMKSWELFGMRWCGQTWATNLVGQARSQGPHSILGWRLGFHSTKKPGQGYRDHICIVEITPFLSNRVNYFSEHFSLFVKPSWQKPKRNNWIWISFFFISQIIYWL